MPADSYRDNNQRRQMIRRISENLLLRPEDLKPLRDDFTVIGVFNPGAVKINGEVVMLVRVAERPLERRPGFVGLPRCEGEGDFVVDWEAAEGLDQGDPRVVRRKSDNLLRLTSISHLRVFRARDGDSMAWTPGPTLLPISPMEEFGIEDPRITEIEGIYWITYVAVSRRGAATALASTPDLATFQRHGVIFCPENKDVVLFPFQIEDQYLSLHRPNPHAHFSRPRVWLPLARSSALGTARMFVRRRRRMGKRSSRRRCSAHRPERRLVGNLSRQPTPLARRRSGCVFGGSDLAGARQSSSHSAAILRADHATDGRF